MDYEKEMREFFKINEFPAYPDTGNAQKDATQFAGTFQQVTLLRNDPVYYSNNATGTSKPDFLLPQHK